MKRKLLVFDSGVGGLSVVAQLRRLLPHAHIDFVADDQFRPYGNKSEAQLRARLPQLLQNLVGMIASQSCAPDAIVLACNTASTTALDAIRSVVDIPVIGVVPAIKPAASASKTNAIGVLGTPRTVSHGYVDDLIKNFAKGCKVHLHGSVGLVEMAEKKLRGETCDLDNIRADLQALFDQDPKIDHVVLACTHFPLLIEELSRCAPYPVKWIDSGAAIARRTKSVLEAINDAPHTDHIAYPPTAFLIGGRHNAKRDKIFTDYGFEKTVCL